jgi:hypothetical protein
MPVSHNVTLDYHLLKCTPVKGAGLSASTNPAIKLKCLQYGFWIVEKNSTLSFILIEK